MAARFVCPDCGTPVVPSGPGRQARCPDCLTLVELPYLPRAAAPRRRAAAHNPARGWAWVAIAVAVAIALTSLTYLLVRGRIHAGRVRTFETLVAQAEADTLTGDFERAVDRLTTATTLANAHDLASPVRLQELRRRLDDLTDRRDALRRQTLETQAAADLTAARHALNGPRADYSLALDRCEAAFAAARDLPTPRAQETRNAARALAVDLIRDRGVDIPEPTGRFLDFAPGPSIYLSRVRPIIETHLIGRGYLPARPASPLAELWSDEAAYRLRMQVNETSARAYMESVLPTAQADLALALDHAGREIWHTRVSGRTRQPAPNIPYPASAAFATARRRDPKAELRLYDDAIEHLTNQLPGRLATLPAHNPNSPGL